MHLELVSENGHWGMEWIFGKNFKVNGGFGGKLDESISYLGWGMEGGIKVFVARACFIYQKCFRIDEEANHRATGPLSSSRTNQNHQNVPTSLSPFCYNGVKAQGNL